MTAVGVTKLARMFAEIYDWFTEGFDTADPKEAKSLLTELATSRAVSALKFRQPPDFCVAARALIGLARDLGTGGAVWTNSSEQTPRFTI